MNCLKRTVFCIILKDGLPVAWGRNHCHPPGGVCGRKDVVAPERAEHYGSENPCNAVHAEINAIGNLPKNMKGPFEAIVVGHDYACEPCADALIRRGVTVIHSKNP